LEGGLSPKEASGGPTKAGSVNLQFLAREYVDCFLGKCLDEPFGEFLDRKSVV